MTDLAPDKPRVRVGPSQKLFPKWVRWIGGISETSKRLKCSPGMVSHIQTRRKLPGRDLATRIQLAVDHSGWKHAILATRWTR